MVTFCTFAFFSLGPMHCSWGPQLQNLAKSTLKLIPTALFTYLKIILLQCFRFSAISDIQTDPYYHSYLVVLYFCRNTCNSYSCCDHTICSAHNIHARTRLHWGNLTCAQASLKRCPSKDSLNSLTSD